MPASLRVAQLVPALGERLLFATSWKGTVLLYRVYRPAYDTRRLAYVSTARKLTAELPLQSQKIVLNSTSMYNTRCLFAT